MRGHRLQLVMIDPFSREILSAGRPSLVILALFPSFVRRSKGSTPPVNGILRSSMSIERKGRRDTTSDDSYTCYHHHFMATLLPPSSTSIHD